jgi:hypothetical protein
MRGHLFRCVGLFSLCLLVSGVAAAKDPGEPYFLNVPSECDAVTGNLVVNCGFETGTFTGWTRTGDQSFTSIERQPHTGDFALVSGPVNGLGFFTQIAPTVVGQSYNLVFWLWNSGQPNRFQVSWEGAVIMDLMNLPNQPYTRYAINGLVACTAGSSLQFGFYNPPDYLHFDDVALTPAVDGEEPE